MVELSKRVLFDLLLSFDSHFMDRLIVSIDDREVFCFLS